MSRRVVRWTDEESAAVAREFHFLTLKGEIPSQVKEGWRKAQESALKPERWKSFANPASATELNKLYKAMVRSKKFADVKPAAIVPIEPPAIDANKIVFIEGKPILKETYEAVVRHQQSVAPPPVVPTFDSVMRNMIREELSTMVPDILRNMAAHMEDVQEAYHHRLMAHIDPAYQDPRKTSQPVTSLSAPARKLQIVVCNAQSAQLQSIEREFPQFEFHPVQDRVPAHENPFLVIGFVSFMSRGQDAACKKKYGDAYIQVVGAASKAKEMLHHRLQHLDFAG